MTTHESTFRRVDWSEDGWQPNDDDDGMPLRPPRGPGIPAADLELLTLAARALGALRVEEIEGEQWVNLHFADRPTAFGWNPVLHGDDTFNLAADLDIDVLQSTTYREAQAVGPMQRVITEPWGDDKRAATRRAVTRAAAEIAKAMG